MKKIFAILSFTALLLCGCTVSELNGGRLDSPVFTASFEEMPGTKTYVDSDLYMYWNADDRLSIFTTTYNQQYRFSGKTGDNGGDFEEVAGGFHSGNSISTNYAVYPYSSTTSLSKDEKISLTMPAVQQYAEGSFGLGANTMVAVTTGSSDYFLAFKNLCGFLVVKLYGEGSVKSVSIKGNNGEKLAGPATVTASHGSAPTLAFGDDATETITIDCGAGVTLGSDASHATEFWFCIPPVSFSKGFTITATNTEGWSMVKSTSTSRKVERNIKTGMSALPAVFDTKVGNVEFDDAIFKSYCLENFDLDGNGEISPSEALAVETISISTQDVKSLKGIEQFSNLTSLYCASPCYPNDAGTYDPTGTLVSLDISHNKKLTYLDCSGNPLNELDLSNNNELKEFIGYYCNFTAIDVTNNPKLTKIYLAGNKLTSIDVTKNLDLEWISVFKNKITSMDISNNPKIWLLFLGDPLKELILPSNTEALKTLNLSGTLLNNIDWSIFPNLEVLELGSNTNMTKYDLSKNLKLKSLMIWGDPQCMESFDISKNTNLEELDLGDNLIEKLDISKNTKLKRISIWNQGKSITDFSVSHLTDLTSLEVNYCGLSSLDISLNKKLGYLSCIGNNFSVLDISENSNMYYLDCTNNTSLKTIFVWDDFKATPYFAKDNSASYVTKSTCVKFNDNNFKSYCVNNFDSNNDGEISFDEAREVKSITVNADDIESLSGIEHFTSLEFLSANGSTAKDIPNGKISSIDISKNTQLKYLYLERNKLTGIDISKNELLEEFYATDNDLGSIDFSKNEKLKKISANGCSLSSIDVSRCQDLEELWLMFNLIEKIDVTKNLKLKILNDNLLR